MDPGRHDGRAMESEVSELQAVRRRVAEQLAARARIWADANDHDPGITLVELMAFLADALSNYQDPVTEEARLGTERRGATVKRRRPALSLEIDGEPWQEVSSLAGSGPGDRDYAVSVDADGGTTVRFGDGTHGRPLPSGTADIRVAYRRGLGYVGVRLQQGRVSLDADWGDPDRAGRLYGIYRAVVVDNLDPQDSRRLLVRVPDVSAQAIGWALPALRAAPDASAPGGGIPAIGDPVWVLFERGDPESPVWVG